MNTAEALAAIFDLVRDGNTAMDRGEFRDSDRAPFLAVLERWDRIFAVLEDNDHAKLLQFGFIQAADLTAAQTESVIGNGYTKTVFVETLAEGEVERRIAERNAVRRGGDFARADKIRDELLAAGVILEDTKAGTRWKRK